MINIWQKNKSDQYVPHILDYDYYKKYSNILLNYDDNDKKTNTYTTNISNIDKKSVHIFDGYSVLQTDLCNHLFQRVLLNDALNLLFDFENKEAVITKELDNIKSKISHIKKYNNFVLITIFV